MGEGSSAVADSLGLALQVLVEHFAAEGRAVGVVVLRGLFGPDELVPPALDLGQVTGLPRPGDKGPASICTAKRQGRLRRDTGPIPNQPLDPSPSLYLSVVWRLSRAIIILHLSSPFIFANTDRIGACGLSSDQIITSPITTPPFYHSGGSHITRANSECLSWCKSHNCLALLSA